MSEIDDLTRIVLALEQRVIALENAHRNTAFTHQHHRYIDDDAWQFYIDAREQTERDINDTLRRARERAQYGG